MMSKLLRCIFGPTLYRIHHADPITGERGRNYPLIPAENYLNTFINIIGVAASASYYYSPFIAYALYRYGHFSTDGVIFIMKIVVVAGCAFAAAGCVRGIIRSLSSDYVTFINSLHAHRKSPTVETRSQLKHYDCNFSALPVDFKSFSHAAHPRFEKCKIKAGAINHLKHAAVKAISYAAMHTVGRWMTYPGSVKIMNLAMWQVLQEYRYTQVEKNGGVRAKLETVGNIHIDTMLLDRRGENNHLGDTLIICCDGNAAYYEAGIMGIPSEEKKRSVLGWNHPGFGNSTGLPFPKQEREAIDAVMQYAINGLKFPAENIILFAWSIGGYTASWAAQEYPQVQSVFLDASFDHILPLAQAHMPIWLKPIVEYGIKTYMNLNVGEQLANYNGPIVLIRRSKDEIILTEMSERGAPNVRNNCGNALLVRILRKRYPFLFDEHTENQLENWLSNEHIQTQLEATTVNNDGLCRAQLMSFVTEKSCSYPITIGENWESQAKEKMLLYLASKYMHDYNKSHCIPLDLRFLSIVPFQESILMDDEEFYFVYDSSTESESP